MTLLVPLSVLLVFVLGAVWLVVDEVRTRRRAILRRESPSSPGAATRRNFARLRDEEATDRVKHTRATSGSMPGRNSVVVSGGHPRSARDGVIQPQPGSDLLDPLNPLSPLSPLHNAVFHPTTADEPTHHNAPSHEPAATYDPPAADPSPSYDSGPSSSGSDSGSSSSYDGGSSSSFDSGSSGGSDGGGSW